MTEEFKSTLFSYLTGRLPKEQGTTEEIFKEINDIPKTSWQNNEMLPSLWNNFKYEGIIQAKGSNMLVIYGGYRTNNDEVRGIITILNNDFTPIKTFFQFDSGTYLQYIMCMIQEEDGSFTMTTCPDYPEDKEWSFTTSDKRFVMVNNFTQKVNENYILSLNKSYIIPYKNNYVRQMYKDPNSSHYVLLCSFLRDQNSPDYDKTRIIELKINVGSENEWSYTDTDDNWILGDSYVEFDEESNSYVELLLTKASYDNNNIATWTKDFKNTEYSYKDIHTFPYKPYIDSYSYQNQSVFLNKKELYFVQNNQRWGNTGIKESKYIGLYYYNIETEEFKTIYEKYLGEFDYCNLEAIYIVNNNNDLYVQFNDNIDNEKFLADYYFQRLVNFEWNPKKISEQQNFIFYQRKIYVSNEFNLLNILMYATNPRPKTWKVYNIKENYNYNKYNGQHYINTNALISDNAEIYSNNSLVFARNLYNKTLNNGTTISTVEIPNTYLNGIDLTSKDLLSQTNLTLVKDTDMLQKNEYETVFLNFINSIVVADKNTTTQRNNITASTYLNNAINNADSYDSAKLYANILLTYQDGSTKEIKCGLEDITDTSCNIEFGLYVDKLLDNAKIMSSDKSTTYQIIDLSSLKQNKIYDIKQKLEVL